MHHGERAPLYFWRDSNGREVDVLLDLGASRVPVEAKAGVTVAADAFRGLENYQRLAAGAAERMAAEGRPGYVAPIGARVRRRRVVRAARPRRAPVVGVHVGGGWGLR